ncbi:cell division protein FtsZ [Mesomycoplasma ovipneumoniae]
MERCSKIMLMGLGDFGSKIVQSLNLDQANFPKFFINSRDEYSNFNFSDQNSLILSQSNFGYDWKKANQAVKDKSLEIQSILAGVKILFLIVGLGGSTGSGAVLEVAEIAQKMNIIIIVLATNPSENESKFRRETSFDVLQNLKKIVDSLILISPEEISSTFPSLIVENVLQLIVLTIQKKISILTKAICQQNALIHVNSSIIESILSNNNFVFVGYASATGTNRAVVATENAFKNHFVEFDLSSSEEMLITISANNSILQTEINDVLNTIRKNFKPDLKFSYGVYTNTKLDKQIEIGIIASQKKHSYESKKAAKLNLAFDNKFSIF